MFWSGFGCEPAEMPSSCQCCTSSAAPVFDEVGEDGHREMLMTVVEVTRRTGVTRKALRVYETMGLVRPARRTDAGYRLYDQEALRRIELINRGKVLGLALAEIERFLEMDGGCCGDGKFELASLVDRKLVETDRRIAELESLRETLRKARAGMALANGAAHRCDETLCTCQVGLAQSGAEGGS